MSRTVELAPPARRTLDRWPEKVRDAVLAFVHGPRSADPYRVGTPLGREPAGLHAARRGSYRVVYRVVDERVLVQVVKAGPGGDVHR